MFFFVFQAPAWSVTCSDWINTACSADITGNVVIYAAADWWHKSKTAKSKKSPRTLLFNVTQDTKIDQSPTLIFNDTDLTRLDSLEKRACYKIAKSVDILHII